MGKLGITVIGFKNISGIRRLFSSLEKVSFDEDSVTLIVSIDYSGDDSVEKYARDFQWAHGEKIILAYKENMGLRKHILRCGDYLEEYSLDAMAVLEDDIFVSPEMYHYMKATVSYYKENPKIAGISLYKHEYNIYAHHPFVDYSDGGDTYFMQYAMSWGQIWLRKQWNDFKEWYNQNGWESIESRRIPENVQRWERSWLKYHIMYCIDKDLFFVYPRVSLTTNFTDPGTHNIQTNTSMQVPLNYQKNNPWNLSDFETTIAVYDAFFENIKLATLFELKNFEVDLYCVKKYADNTRYVITRKIMPYKVVKSWGMALRPLEANIIHDIPGQEIFLYDLTEKEIKSISNTKQKSKILEYDLKGIDIVNSANVSLCFSKILKYIRIKIKQIKKKIRH